MNDEEIVRQVRAGDREAYSHLVIRYQNAVYGLAYHCLRDFEDARDVAQESFVQGYLHLGQLQSPNKFGAWIRQIAANQCRMWMRRHETTEPLENVTESTNEMRQLETRLVVQDALSCLSEESRLTIILYYFQSYSLQEIASFLEVPVTTIKSRLRNARARLQKELMHIVEQTLTHEPLPADFPTRVLQSITSSGAVHSLSFSRDGRLLANDNCIIVRLGEADFQYRHDDNIQVWNAASGQLLHTFHPSRPAPPDCNGVIMGPVAFSPDNNLLAAGSSRRIVHGSPVYDGDVLLWNVDTGLLQNAFPVSGVLKSVTFSPDGKLVAGSISTPTEGWIGWVTRVNFWNSETGELVSGFEIGNGMAFTGALTFAPDGRRIAIGIGQVGEAVEGKANAGWGDCQVAIYDAISGALIHALDRHHGDAQSDIAFSPDSRFVATGVGPEGDILVWDTESGAQLRTLKGHEHRAYAVAYSSDGTLIASGSQDRTVKLWDAATGKLLRTMEGHSTSVHAVMFAPDGSSLASADIDCIVKIWALR